jgi:membrane protein implicated in regulation of membrane protease activity
MNFRDFLGGHPITVILRLAIISLLVGIVLSIFGITPGNFFYVIDNFIRLMYDLGFGTIEWILQYLAVGAMLVVPIWLLLRLLRSRPARQDGQRDE